MYFAVDPGEGRTDTIGWALFNRRGELKSIGQTSFNELIRMLEKFTSDGVDIECVICEDYRIRREKLTSHVGSRVETVQTIGAIRAWCTRNDVKMKLQPSRILKLASMQFGITIPKDHSKSHQISATLHGFWYLRDIGKVRAVMENNVLKLQTTVDNIEGPDVSTATS